MLSVSNRVALTVISFLGATSVILSLGVIWLAHEGRAPDAGLYTLGGTAIGALASILANMQGRHDKDEPVAVTATEPLPVTDETPPDESEAGAPITPTPAAPSPLAKAVQKR